MDRDTLMDRVYRIVQIAKRARAAEIDAGACQTRRDFDAAHVAEDALSASQDLLRADLIVEDATEAWHRAKREVLRHNSEMLRYQGEIEGARNRRAAAESLATKAELARDDAIAARKALDTQTND